MSEEAREPNFEAAAHKVRAIREELTKAVIGQDEVVDQVLEAFLASGHVLVEGVPGLGKTLMVVTLSKAIGVEFNRVQFTPDLMPSDVMGHAIYEGTGGDFRIRRGPVFTNLLLADEINRAPAKTQSALLEVMQERQVSIEGTTYELQPPFMALATQNPIEQDGTYPLPEAQLDRFLMKVRISYPGVSDEFDIVESVTRDRIGDSFRLEQVDQVMNREQARRLQKITARVAVDRRIVEYAVHIARATREWSGVSTGAGPRGAISMVRASRAAALMQGRDHVLPDDVKSVAVPALRHRLVLTPEVELEQVTPEEILDEILHDIEVPRS